MVFICIPMIFHQGPLYKTHITLTSFHRVVLEADPLAAGFGVHGQELFLLLSVDADQIGSSGHTVLMCGSPALLQGPVHTVEQLQEIRQSMQCNMMTSRTYKSNNNIYSSAIILHVF